ncbi:tyrosine-type recombinase/integrase [Sphingorhabdus sp.]|uniref:tyrosine-type recombinase/integrase n=1 Tax=Sphingorhabdus sp. TaxID=1902408 RepID=UPI00391C6633
MPRTAKLTKTVVDALIPEDKEYEVADEKLSEFRLRVFLIGNKSYVVVTGCRSDEICQLKWSYVEWSKQQICWPDTKTGGLAKPISGAIRDLLSNAQRYDGNECVCPTLGSGAGHLSSDVLRGTWSRVLIAAGVSHCGIHALRHWFASAVYADPKRSSGQIPFAVCCSAYSVLAVAKLNGGALQLVSKSRCANRCLVHLIGGGEGRKIIDLFYIVLAAIIPVQCYRIFSAAQRKART